jgi:choline dehydrogenase-like flavoprotein
MTILAAIDLPDSTVLRAPVAILGAGAAGITLALRLAERGVASVLIESGVDDYDDRTQQLYQGESPGYWDLTTTRLRQFGGTTNHFNGQSRPLERSDFGDAAWRPGTSWPIGYDELTRRLPDAVELLALAGDRWAVDDWFPGTPPPLANPSATGTNQPAMDLLVFQQRAGSMGARYRDRLAASDLVTVVQGAHATRVALTDDASRVASVDLVSFAQNAFTVEADAYVVALGGIESARLLLASDDRLPNGVGNGSDHVGRYFADHAEVVLPPVVTDSSPAWSNPSQAVDGPDGSVAVYTMFGLNEQAQSDLNLPGFHARLSVFPVPFAVDDPAAVAVSGLLDPSGEMPVLANSVVLAMETEPNPQSRVTLSAERNELGERNARLDWVLTDADEIHLARIVELVAWQLARQNFGRLPMVPPLGTWSAEVVGQHHHMGTLRMSATPATGVVDANQRFHEVPNLYAAGSSVFPTYGHVNPTLNLVALSLRLADHLADTVVR